MKRLLVIGASKLQVPAIAKAKEMGLVVATADYDPAAPGIALADAYYNVSTIDEQGIYEAARDFRADGIVTLATDMPVRSLAYARERLCLPGLSYEAAVKATDKGAMIEAFDAAAVAHPAYFIAATRDEAVSFASKAAMPLVFKPTDNSGSRGVQLVEERNDAVRAFYYASDNGRSGSVIVEEYMQGPEVSVELVVVDGVPHVIQVTDKLTTGSPYFVEMGHSQPSLLPEGSLSQIRDLASRAALSVGIENGPAHAEIILTDCGPKMVEIGARLGGDCITTHLVPLSTGVDLVKATIQIALGEMPDIDVTKSMGSAIRFIAPRPGLVTAVSGLDAARAVPGVIDLDLKLEGTAEVGEVVSSLSRIGSVVAQGDTAEGAARACELAVAEITFSYEGQ